MWKPTLISVKSHMKLTVLFWYEEYILMDQNVKAKLKLTSRISWKKKQQKKTPTQPKKSSTNMKPSSSQSAKADAQ